MRWFRRRKPEFYLAESMPRPASQRVCVLVGCVFCGAHGATAGLSELTDSAYGKSHGLCCAGCREDAARFQARVRYLTRAGNSPWVVPDAGTERSVQSGPDQLAVVRGALGSLEGGIRTVPRGAARIAALRLGVYGAEADEPAVASRTEAVGSVARAVARNLAVHHKHVLAYSGGKDYLAHSVALFADGRGVLHQEVGTDGTWFRQHCFLVDRDFGVHRYRAYDR